MKIPLTRYAIQRFNPKLEAQYRECAAATEQMHRRSHARFHIINALLKCTPQRRYLEIGVRNPADNFDKIIADHKVSVDPGVESRVNCATFPMTSDEFFAGVFDRSIQLKEERFDVIFIDGLHLAEQVYRDIQNALRMIADVGFIVLHDCNPPTIHHARENFTEQGPATHFWNGTSWKAYQRFRTESDKRCFVVDVDWGVGVIVNHEEDPSYRLSSNLNPFFEYNTMDRNRTEILNLVEPMRVPELRANL